MGHLEKGGRAGVRVSACGMILSTVNKITFISNFVSVKLNQMFFCQELALQCFCDIQSKLQGKLWVKEGKKAAAVLYNKKI